MQRAKRHAHRLPWQHQREQRESVLQALVRSFPQNLIQVESQTRMPAFAGPPGENTRFRMATSGPIEVLCDVNGQRAYTVLKLAN